MREVRRSALVPYTAQQMYTLVEDIEAYPDFLPWCSRALVHERDAQRVRASLEILKGGARSSFTTINRLTPHSAIDIELETGPFRTLSGHWRFEPRGAGGCQVTLQLSFAFANALTGLLFGPAFEHSCNSLVDAFARRARAVHGHA